MSNPYSFHMDINLTKTHQQVNRMPNKSPPTLFSNILEAGSQHKLHGFQAKAVKIKASIVEMIKHYI